MRDIPAGFEYKNASGHVEWAALSKARRAEAPGWWRVEVWFDDGNRGNKFFNDGEMEIGNGSG